MEGAYRCGKRADGSTNKTHMDGFNGKKITFSVCFSAYQLFEIDWLGSDMCDEKESITKESMN